MSKRSRSKGRCELGEERGKRSKYEKELKNLSRPMLSPFRTKTCKYFLRDSFCVIHLDVWVGRPTSMRCQHHHHVPTPQTGKHFTLLARYLLKAHSSQWDHEYGRPANAHGVSTTWPGNLTPPAPIDEHEFPTTRRRADPGSPLLQHAREESDARASVHHSEREGTHRSRYLLAPGHLEQDVEVRAKNMSGHGSLKGKTSRR